MFGRPRGNVSHLTSHSLSFPSISSVESPEQSARHAVHSPPRTPAADRKQKLLDRAHLTLAILELQQQPPTAFIISIIIIIIIIRALCSGGPLLRPW